MSKKASWFRLPEENGRVPVLAFLAWETACSGAVLFLELLRSELKLQSCRFSPCKDVLLNAGREPCRLL